MGEFYTYQKKRREFGKTPNFSDSEIKHFGFFPANIPNWNYLHRNPNFIDLDNIPQTSEHIVNTERVANADKGMFHQEGGWSIGIDPTEPVETQRWRKKVEREVPFMTAVKDLASTVEKCIEQNNQIDLFEEYFINEESEHLTENITTKTLLLFKDQCQKEGYRRSISEISWSPEGPTKVAVSYAINLFQQMPEKMPVQSYVWDLQNPNVPELVLTGPSPCTNISYNQKQSDMIGGGCYNGLVAIWDVKRHSSQPALISPVEKSHSDPITHLSWLSMKTGTELITSSTDGRVFWWDTRQFSKGPIDTLLLTENVDGKDRVVGGSVIEFNAEAGANKFLVGTEQGIILNANKKPKKNVEITGRFGLEGGRHLGPIYALNRSIPNQRYFLSVGDWSAKIWFEELKSPIIRTRYHGAYLTDGCFSPTRPGVFFLTRKDGWMDVWDLYYRQNEFAYSHKVSDCALTCLKLNYNAQEKGYAAMQGKLVAVGDSEGVVTVIELCDSLNILQPKEKEVITEMFDRETRKEKNLEMARKQLEKLKPVKDNNNQKNEQELDQILKEVEDEFFQTIAKDTPQTGESDKSNNKQSKQIKKNDLIIIIQKIIQIYEYIAYINSFYSWIYLGSDQQQNIFIKLH